MRLETRYIDIGKSISIIDRNFHIDFISTISIIYGNTNYNVCNYLSMLGLKLIHVSKRGYNCSGCWSFITVLVRIMSVHLTVIQYICLSGCMPLLTQLFYTMNHPQSELESVDFVQMFNTAENTHTGTHIPFLPGDMLSHFCTLHLAV